MGKRIDAIKQGWRNFRQAAVDRLGQMTAVGVVGLLIAGAAAAIATGGIALGAMAVAAAVAIPASMAVLHKRGHAIKLKAQEKNQRKAAKEAAKKGDGKTISETDALDPKAKMKAEEQAEIRAMEEKIARQHQGDGKAPETSKDTSALRDTKQINLQSSSKTAVDAKTEDLPQMKQRNAKFSEQAKSLDKLVDNAAEKISQDKTEQSQAQEASPDLSSGNS